MPPGPRGSHHFFVFLHNTHYPNNIADHSESRICLLRHRFVDSAFKQVSLEAPSINGTYQPVFLHGPLYLTRLS